MLHETLAFKIIKDHEVHTTKGSKRFDSALKIDDGMKRNTKRCRRASKNKVPTSTSTCLFMAIPRLATRKLFILVSSFANDR